MLTILGCQVNQVPMMLFGVDLGLRKCVGLLRCRCSMMSKPVSMSAACSYVP